MYPDIGVVLYDDPAVVGPGWAAQAGERARRIDGNGDLSTAVVWITNMKFTAFRESGLFASGRFRDESYLRVPIRALRAELGLGRDEDNEEAAAILAELAGNVISVAHRFGLNTTALPARSLSAGFSKHYMSNFDKARQPEAFQSIMRGAVQSYVFCERMPKRDNDVAVALYRHRPRHAIDMLGVPVPVGSWSLQAFDRVPRSIEDLIEYPKPILAKVEVHRIDKLMAPIVAYGASGSMDTMRQWVPQHELRLLNQCGEVEVKEVMVGERFAPLPMDLGSFTVRDEISYAVGIALDCLWHSVLRDEANRATLTPAAVWVQATDRILLLREIRRMLNATAGVSITGYGHGRINLRIPMRSSETWGIDLYELVDQSPLIPPLNTEEPLAPPRRLAEDAGAAEVIQQIMLRGQRQLVMKADRQLVPRVSGAICARREITVTTRRPAAAAAQAPPPARAMRIGDTGARVRPERGTEVPVAVPTIDEIDDD